MLNFSSDLIQYKNLLVDTGAWIILIEIPDAIDPIANDSLIRICSNTQEIEWPTGSTKSKWSPFPFILDSFGENSKSEIPTTSLKICNIDRMLNSFLEENHGLLGRTVIIRIIHTKALNIVEGIPIYKFKIKSVSVNNQWVTLTIGADSLFSKQDPMYKMNRTFCRYKRRLDDNLCGYTKENPGHTQVCDGTLSKCRELGWVFRFGGFPGMNPTNLIYG